jgi:hypothetical protein
LKAEATPVGPESGEPSPLDGFDGCAIFEITDFESFAAAFNDDYYLTIIEPDERKFIDKNMGVVRARGDVKKIL